MKEWRAPKLGWGSGDKQVKRPRETLYSCRDGCFIASFALKKKAEMEAGSGARTLACRVACQSRDDGCICPFNEISQANHQSSDHSK